MRIHFERTGGLAGPAARRSCTVDADSLPEGEAKEFHDLVREANVPALAGHSPAEGEPARPDAFRYRLTLEDGGRQHALEVGESAMPATLRPLIKWLTKRATP
jgi:hypothetical protein